MKRLVLIDGINFFYKGAWQGGVNLTCKGEDVTYIYAFFRNLVSLVRQLEEDKDVTTFCICWDGGYTERLRISSEARDKGIIPKIYKQERRESYQTEDPEQQKLNEEFKRQLKIVENLVGYTRVHSAFVRGEEADDLIGSFVKSNLGKYDEIVLVTTDRDYYQLLYSGVRMYNSSNRESKDVSYLKAEYNLDKPEQWVDVGAVAGETGKSSDTIYGVPGIGYTTAAKLISQYGTLDNLIETAEKELKSEIESFGSAKALYDAVKAHEYKLKHHTKEMYVLAHKEIVGVAKQLKQMRTWLDIPLPELNVDFTKLDNEFRRMQFVMGTKDLDLLTFQKVVPNPSVNDLV